MEETAVPAAIDWLLCIIALVAFLKPRFDQWPSADTGRYQGAPRDYIHWERYTTFVGLYMGSFILFVMALKMIPMAGMVMANGDNAFSTTTAAILGKDSMVTAVMIALAALSSKQVAALDDRWRNCLLQLARIPRETHTLAQRIETSLHQLIMSGDPLETALARLAEQGHAQFWRDLLALPSSDAKSQKHLPLLRALYIIQCDRMFELTALDRANLDKHELRLEEMAAMLATRHLDSNDDVLVDYIKEIKTITQSVIEIFARHCVKHCPDEERRFALLAQQGFKLEYSDQPELIIVAPILLSILSIAVVSVLTLMLALHLFDLIGLPLAASNDGSTAPQWLTPARVMNWGSGAVISYTVAIAIGSIFGLIMQRREHGINLPNAILAVVFSALASCVYFQIASDQIKPPLIWLSLSFALMALVTIVSLHTDVEELEEYQGRVTHFIRRRAMQIGLMYGAASALLQIMICVSFALSFGQSPKLLTCVVFAVFGFTRGFLLGFLVSHIIIDYRFRHLLGSRRRFPRFSLGRTLQGSVSGRPSALFVRDISEQGAMVRMRPDETVNCGDTISLTFNEGNIDGTVVWAGKRKARVKFRVDAGNLPLWQSVLRNNINVNAA